MNAKGLAAILIGTAFFLLFVYLCTPYYAQWPAMAGGTTAGEELWGGRAFETIFQGFILMAGVISVLLLVRPGTTGRRPP